MKLRKLFKAVVLLFIAMAVSTAIGAGVRAAKRGDAQPTAVELANRSAQGGKLLGPIIAKVQDVGGQALDAGGTAIRDGKLPSVRSVRGTSQIPTVVIVLAVIGVLLLVIQSYSKKGRQVRSGKQNRRSR